MELKTTYVVLVSTRVNLPGSKYPGERDDGKEGSKGLEEHPGRG
jgi:hypothetical protein